MKLFQNSKFTKLKKDMKCLQMELVPTEETKIALEQHKIHEMDQVLKEKSKIVQEPMDQFYVSLMNTILGQFEYDWEQLYELYVNRKENANEFDETVAECRKSMAECFAKSFKAAYGKADILFKGGFLKIFTDEVTKNPSNYPAGLLDTLSDLKGCSALFTNYFTSRENIFSDKDYVSVAYRMINDNFTIFAENMNVFQKFATDYPDVATKLMQDLHITFDMNDANEYAKLLTEEGREEYQRLISGYTDGESYIKGFNQTISEMNSLTKSSKNESGNHTLYRRMTKLKKQILVKTASQFKFPVIENDDELKASIQEFVKKMDDSAAIDNLFKLFNQFSSYDESRIFVEGNRLSAISHAVAKNFSLLENILTEKKEKNIKKKAYSIERLDELFAEASEESVQPLFIADMIYNNMKQLKDDYISCYNKLVQLKMDSVKIKDNEEATAIVKDYLDSVVNIARFGKMFLSNEESKDLVFYDVLESSLDNIGTVIKLYNMTRSYITRKVGQNVVKQRSCLGKVSLLSKNSFNNANVDVIAKDEQFIVEMDGKYYYGTPTALIDHKIEVLEQEPKAPSYKKFTIKKLDNIFKQLPRFLFDKETKVYFNNETSEPYVRTKNMKKPFTITFDDYMVYQRKWFTTAHIKANVSPEEQEKLKKEYRADLTHYIDFCKRFIDNYKAMSCYHFDTLKAADEYRDINEFYSDLEALTCRFSQGYILKSEMDSLIASQMVYLFLIRSKSLYKDVIKDEQAILFKYLLSKENADRPVVLLGADPKITYRKAAKEKHITHPKNSVLVNKIDKNGNRVPEKIYKELYEYHNSRLDTLSKEAKTYDEIVVKKKAAYDIIKDRRYCEDKYILTIAYTLNCNITKETDKEINSKVKEQMQSGECNVLTVVRGEKNLLYVVLQDWNGDVITSKSLNIINGVNYYNKLKQLDYDRKEDQRNWKNEKTVATLKEGYLSHAISEIIRMALDNNAVICIENISPNFKNKRACIDNQVYQKFETAIIKRLASYTRRDIPMGEPGSIINPLQLARTDGKGMQNGILFRVNTMFTANTCPETGFTNLFDMRSINNTTDKYNFLKMFDRIAYSVSSDTFEFEFNYANFKLKGDIKSSGKWVLNTDGIRTIWDRVNKKFDEVDITEELKENLTLVDTPYAQGENLVTFIESDGAINKKVVNVIMNAFKEVMTTRICKKDGEDLFHSPVVGTFKNNMPADYCTGILLGRKFLLNQSKDKVVKAEEWIDWLQEK